jgi:alpha-1,2-mannosyltransferase
MQGASARVARPFLGLRSYLPALVGLGLVLLGMLISLAVRNMPWQFDPINPLITILKFAYGALTGAGIEHASDSWMPMLEALEVARSERPLYETVFFEGRVKFQYPPTSLIPLLPFEGMERGDAYLLLNRINLLFFVATAFVCAAIGMHDVRLDRHKIFWAAAMLACAALFVPLVKGLAFGQIQVWIDLLVAGAALAWLRGRRSAAGVLLGIATLIKPQFGVLLVWSAVRGEIGFARGFILAGLPLGLLSLWLFGWQNHLGYLEVLSFLSERGEAYFANNSINGILLRAAGIGHNVFWEFHGFPPRVPIIAGITSAVTLAAVGLVLIGAWRRRGRPTGAVELLLVILIVTMASPIAWEHHYAVALPLFALLARELMLGRKGRDAALLAVAWGLMAIDLKFLNLLHDTPLNFVQAHLFWGSVALVLAALLRDGGSIRSWIERRPGGAPTTA